MKKEKQGFAIHCHHNILVEWCYNYGERVRAIKEGKPKSEQKIRLKLFKLLPKEAMKEIPDYYREADQKRQEADQKRQEADQKQREAYQEWQRADQKWQRADQKRWEAYQKWRKADQKWQRADQKWSQKNKDAFHKKWCGCSHWKKGQISFTNLK